MWFSLEHEGCGVPGEQKPHKLAICVTGDKGGNGTVRKIYSSGSVMGCTHLITALWRDRQKELNEFEVSLVYIVSSRKIGTVQYYLYLKKLKTNKLKVNSWFFKVSLFIYINWSKYHYSWNVVFPRKIINFIFLKSLIIFFISINWDHYLNMLAYSKFILLLQR